MSATSFSTESFEVTPEVARFFTEHLDGNPVHLPGNFNEILPTGTVPGLCVISLASKALLKVSQFKNVLCAKSFEIRFVSPIFVGQKLRVDGEYTDAPHRKRPHIQHRVATCRVVAVSSGELHAEYTITQLIGE